jgi:hypothetical protein
MSTNSVSKKRYLWQPILAGFFLLVSLIVACNKKFDEPPVYSGPEIKPNFTIRELRGMHFPGNFEKVLDELIVECTVIADDSKDNFYKSIVVQDSTGGITIRMDGFGLYNDYPVGRKVFIKLKNLWLGDYAKMIQLGAGVDRSDSAYPELSGIPVPLFDKFLVKSSLHNPIVPMPASPDQLHDSLQSRLIIIRDAEFAPADTGKPYADAVNKLSVNNIIKSCGGGSVYLRTSGFANFAALKTPRGNGSITAVYSVFGTSKQLLIRDTSDVQMNGLRCTGAGSKLLLSEDFETAVPNTVFSPAGWKNIAEAGGKTFLGKITGNNRYAEISAFATSQPAVISWLILPPVNLNNSANEVLNFQTKDGFDNGAVLQVYASTNYDGGNTPWKAKWTLLKAVVSKGSVSSIASDWVSSGNISLSSLSGVVYIAFRYDGADPSSAFDKRTTSFQIDNVRIVGN